MNSFKSGDDYSISRKRKNNRIILFKQKSSDAHTLFLFQILDAVVVVLSNEKNDFSKMMKDAILAKQNTNLFEKNKILF